MRIVSKNTRILDVLYHILLEDDIKDVDEILQKARELYIKLKDLLPKEQSES